MRHIPNKMKRFQYWLTDLVIPPSCAVCGRVETWLCENCASEILIFEGSICPRCGKRRENQASVCPTCQRTPLQVNPVRSVFDYNETIRTIIHALKYRGATEIISRIAEHLERSWKKYALPSDLLVPVPLHETRERKRGYNQSAIIIQTLTKRTGIPANSLLTRSKKTASQTHLNREERQQNVKAAFTCTSDIDISGKHITLVDDVATTGATLNACATVLFAHGAKSVNAFTLARAT